MIVASVLPGSPLQSGQLEADIFGGMLSCESVLVTAAMSQLRDQ